MTTFFSLGANQRIKKDNKLIKLANLIDKSKIEKRLKGFHKKELIDKGGQRPYAPIKTFKAPLLGQQYSLSDQEAISPRIDP